MKRLILALGIAAALSQALFAGTDSDFDGVADADDRCPATPFDLAVSADGCPIPKESQTPVSLLVGVGTTYATGTYGGTDTIDSLSTELSATLYAGNFYASAVTAYYFRGAYDPTVAGDDNGGISDTFLGAGYMFTPAEHLYLTPGIFVKLATAAKGMGTGENDYGTSLQALYRFEKSDVFVQYGYTVTGDSSTVTYRDVSYGSVGAGYYPNPQSYLSLSYDVSQAYEPGFEDLESLSFFGIFTLYDTLSLRINYSYGLSDSASDHLVSAMLLKRF